MAKSFFPRNARGSKKGKEGENGKIPEFCHFRPLCLFVSPIGTPVRYRARQQAVALWINRVFTRAALLGHLLAQGTPFKVKLIGAALAPP